MANRLYGIGEPLTSTRALTGQIDRQQRFIADLTHEMKTPIAIIQNQCECVLENIAPEKNEEYLKSIYDII